MTTNRLQEDRGFCNPEALPKGPHGRALCRQCHQEVPQGRQSFCSNECVDDWKVRTDPTFVRRKLFDRDKGVCAICGTDTVKQVKELEKIEGPVDYWVKKTSLYYKTVTSNQPLMEKLSALQIPVTRYLAIRRRKGLWDADHIVPVIEGGGECGIEGYRTLCIRCHKGETKKLRVRRARAKKKERASARPLSYVSQVNP